MIKSLKDLLDKLSRFTNSLVYDGGICKRLDNMKIRKRLYHERVCPKSQASCEKDTGTARAKAPIAICPTSSRLK